MNKRRMTRKKLVIAKAIQALFKKTKVAKIDEAYVEYLVFSIIGQGILARHSSLLPAYVEEIKRLHSERKRGIL